MYCKWEYSCISMRIIHYFFSMPANLNKFEAYIYFGVSEFRYFVIEVYTRSDNKNRISIRRNCTSIRIRNDNTKLMKYNINITQYHTTGTPKQNHNTYVKVDILLTCGKHLNDSIIPPRKEIWFHKASSPMTLYQPGKWAVMYLCSVLDISILPLSTILIFAFGIVLTVWDFLFLFLILFTLVTFCCT